MRCANCPLFSWWNNENDKGESCGLFGDSWDSCFQYEDKDGSIVGCYIEKAFIDKAEKRIEQEHEAYVNYMLNQKGW